MYRCSSKICWWISWFHRWWVYRSRVCRCRVLFIGFIRENSFGLGSALISPSLFSSCAPVRSPFCVRLAYEYHVFKEGGNFKAYCFLNTFCSYFSYLSSSLHPISMGILSMLFATGLIVDVSWVDAFSRWRWRSAIP